MELYLKSILSMGGIAALLAAGLGYASLRFRVEKDQRLDDIEEALPGVNCGACGYAGCSSFAEAVVTGEASVSGCPVGGEEVAARLAEIMGEDASTAEEETARVLCRGGINETARWAEYRGIESCAAVDTVNGETKACEYGCLGYGDCAAVCPFEAIEMNDNGLPEIDPEKCTGCGECVEACPKNIIILAPRKGKNDIYCSSHDGAARVTKICEVGCIGCGQCIKICPVDAITMKDNLAVLDYEKCINCGLCAEKCPTGTIEFSGQKIKDIYITEACIGCTKCARECPVNAIEGEVKKKHEIDQETCIKCGLCYQVCPQEGAIAVEYEED
ncbi:MAG: RnfABCDGE type electron transport complex subunit B [Halanaerobiaceae bacterium]